MPQRKVTFETHHTALADHTTRAAMTAITVPKGYGGRIYKIEVMNYGTNTTDDPSGGLIEVENGSVDWKPFKFYMDSHELLTTTGADIQPTEIECDLPLPDSSVITIYYTARNAETDAIVVILYVEIGKACMKQTYMDTAVGAAVTAAFTNTSKHVTFTAIPATKGGKLKQIRCVVLGSPETLVAEGGMVAAWASPAWGEPIKFSTGTIIGTTTMAGVHRNRIIETDADLPDGAIVYADFYSIDNQSQFLQMGIMWTKS